MVNSGHPSVLLKCLAQMSSHEGVSATPSPCKWSLPSAIKGSSGASGQEGTSLYTFPGVAGQLPSWFL